MLGDFLPMTSADELLGWAVAHESRFEPTWVGHGGGERRDESLRVSVSVRDFQPYEEDIRQRALEIGPSLFADFGVTPSRIDAVELELVAHNDGAYYRRHMDTATGSNWALQGARVLSAVYYLFRRPKGFDGGQLRLHPFGDGGGEPGALDIEPQHNALVVFPSWAAHEVLPVSCPSGRFADSRFAVNIWFRTLAPSASSRH